MSLWRSGSRTERRASRTWVSVVGISLIVLGSQLRASPESSLLNALGAPPPSALARRLRASLGPQALSPVPQFPSSPVPQFPPLPSSPVPPLPSSPVPRSPVPQFPRSPVPQFPPPPRGALRRGLAKACRSKWTRQAAAGSSPVQILCSAISPAMGNLNCSPW